MDEILISYVDFGGDETERRISDIRAESPASIDAYCHLREGRRTFRVDRIARAVDLNTGEALNPWKFISNGQAKDGRERLESLTWHVLPAIKALKFFMLTTRGGRKREVVRLVHFIQEVVDVSAYTSDEIFEWVKGLWCGNIYEYAAGSLSEYTNLLRNIPSTVLGQCRTCALLMAKGSGRKPIQAAWLDRIENEFSPNPIVKKPETPDYGDC